MTWRGIKDSFVGWYMGPIRCPRCHKMRTIREEEECEISGCPQKDNSPSEAMGEAKEAMK